MRWNSHSLAISLSLALAVALIGGDARAQPTPDLTRYDAKQVQARKDVKRLIKSMKKPRKIGDLKLPGLTDAEIKAFFEDERAKVIYWEKLVDVVEASFPKRHRMTHVEYFKRLLKPERVAQGVAFEEKHRAALKAAEEKWKVSRWDLVAILMAETKLGTITGDYQVANAFLTAFLYSNDAVEVADEKFRSKAKGEGKKKRQIKNRIKKNRKRVKRRAKRAGEDLAILLQMCKAKKQDAFKVMGSWAGAIGFPQFMPRSLRHALDGDSDGDIDLMSWPDTFQSMGRYLYYEGYRKGRRKGIWSYNHDSAYVEGVMNYGDAVKKASAEAAKAPEGAAKN